MKKLKLLFLLLLSVAFASAQTNVTGTVKGDDGFGIPTVNVVEKGTSNGTTTDFDGNFSIQAKKGDTLVFSFIGYNSTSISIDNNNNYIIPMLPDNAQLDEVVVMGYGINKKVITSMSDNLF